MPIALRLGYTYYTYIIILYYGIVPPLVLSYSTCQIFNHDLYAYYIASSKYFLTYLYLHITEIPEYIIFPILHINILTAYWPVYSLDRVYCCNVTTS